MRRRPFILIIFFFSLITSTSHAQPDTTNVLVEKHWSKLRTAHQNFLNATIRFSSIEQVRIKYPKASNNISDKAKSYLSFINNRTFIDSSFVLALDTLTSSMNNSLIVYFEQLQKDKALFGQQRIKQEAKKLEFELETISRQIHDFNYWVNERNGKKIRFKEVNW